MIAAVLLSLVATAAQSNADVVPRLDEKTVIQAPKHSPEWTKINLNHQDVIIHAGMKSSAYAELVRANPDESCEFKFYQPSDTTPEDGYFHTTAKIDEQIDEGASDYLGYLLKCDYASQTALVREFDLTKTP